MARVVEEVQIVNKDYLDHTCCSNDNCTNDHSEMYLSGDCHMRAPLYIKYVKKTGQLEITCSICNAQVVNIQLESGAKSEEAPAT